jgi:hypothetical protein
MVMLRGRSLRAATIAHISAMVGCCVLASHGYAKAERSLRTRRGIGEQVSGGQNDTTYNSVVMLSTSAHAVAVCSGTLVAPNLVLTARHCLSQVSPGNYGCDLQTGEVTAGSGSGGIYLGNTDAASINVFAGDVLLPFASDDAGASSPVAVGSQIIHDNGISVCTHDIAFLLLNRPVTGWPTAPVRLAGPPTQGEVFSEVGWGLTGPNQESIYRQRLDNLMAVDIGPATPSATASALASTFQAGPGICSGDSGGPAIDPTTGAVIGIMQGFVTPTSGQVPCGNPAATGYYQQIDTASDLFSTAFAIAGYEPWLEGQPNPLLAPYGAACVLAADCQSNYCVGGTCNFPCPCPTGYACDEDGGTADADAGTCSLAPDAGASDDGGQPDAASGEDASMADSGSLDAGSQSRADASVDASIEAGRPDGGGKVAAPPTSSALCSAAGGAAGVGSTSGWTQMVSVLGILLIGSLRRKSRIA